VAGYPYSPALKASGLVWDEVMIDRLFAEGPRAVAPGSKMPLQKMPSAMDRAALIHMKALLASKAFIAGVVVALGIGALAMVVSGTVDPSARDTYKMQDVRL
jgi:hypothetical protein